MPDISSNIVTAKQDVALPDSVDGQGNLKTTDKDMDRLIEVLRIVAAHLEIQTGEEIEEGWR